MTPAERRAYANNRRRLQAYGRWQPHVDAAPVREHIQAVLDTGLTRNRYAALAQVRPAAITRILHGSPAQGIPPQARVRTAVAQRLLAVHPGTRPSLPAARVDATGTRRRLQALVATGWSQRSLARMLASAGTRPAWGLIHGQPHVTVATERAVRALYARLWDQPPPETTRDERYAAAVARRCAARHGWEPPLAWDDDEIDDPAAQPHPWKRTKLRKAEDLAADVYELEARGYTREQIAARFGLTTSALQKAVERDRALRQAAEAASRRARMTLHVTTARITGEDTGTEAA